MSRAEFITTQTESERRIGRRVIPLGVLYSIRLVTPLVILILAVFLPSIWKLGLVGFRVEFVIGLIGFIFLFVSSFPLERDSKRQFRKLALMCPECQSYLVFMSYNPIKSKTLETGCCYHCGKRVFDL
jgi:hypothetical protein